MKKQRLLRSYRRIAWTPHHCSKCEQPIFPGDEYSAEVYAMKREGVRSFIRVLKFHDDCPWNKEWEEEIEKEFLEWCESFDQQAKEELPLAA